MIKKYSINATADAVIITGITDEPFNIDVKGDVILTPFVETLSKQIDVGDTFEFENYSGELNDKQKLVADTLRKNRTIDWQKRDSARAKMRMMIKKLLKKHRYPPEGMDDAVQTVMIQCELWTDNARIE